MIDTTKGLTLSKILKQLLFDQNMRPADLARAINIPIPTIHRIVTGKSANPSKKSLSKIADYLNVNVDQLMGRGNLRSKLNNTNGDNILHETDSNNIVVSVIPWDNLGTPVQDGIKKIVVNNVSSRAFAVIMPDHSMSPLFQQGSTLIFDPELAVKDHDYVLVKLNDVNMYVFRQLILDINQKFIKALNSDISNNSLKPLGSADIVLARVVEVRNHL